MNDYPNPVEDSSSSNHAHSAHSADLSLEENSVSLPPSWSYETTIAEIEVIIHQIERGELELADVFDQFARAVERLRQCETFLTRQQQQVDLLIETLLDEPDSF
jgi:exodeoxyribonuclease VII small subunit